MFGQSSGSQDLQTILRERTVEVDQDSFRLGWQRFAAEFDSLQSVIFNRFYSPTGDHIENPIPHQNYILHEGVYNLVGNRYHDDFELELQAISLFTFNGEVQIINSRRESKSTPVEYLSDFDQHKGSPGPPQLLTMKLDELIARIEIQEQKVREFGLAQKLSYQAEMGIIGFRRSYDIRLQCYGEISNYPPEQAILDANLDKETLGNWHFQTYGIRSLYPRVFLATSTSNNPAGPGKQVWYDVDETMYHGYGVDNQIFDSSKY
jgi:hypothetical protein